MGGEEFGVRINQINQITHKHAHAHTYILTYLHTHIHIHTYIHIHTHTCTHTHIIRPHQTISYIVYYTIISYTIKNVIKYNWSWLFIIVAIMDNCCHYGCLHGFLYLSSFLSAWLLPSWLLPSWLLPSWLLPSWLLPSYLSLLLLLWLLLWLLSLLLL